MPRLMRNGKPAPPEFIFRELLPSAPERAMAMLDENPALLNARVFDNETSLHYWAVESHTEIVSLLLSRGADPNINAEFSSPLLDAASVGALEVCKLLLKAGADIGYNDIHCDRGTPLHAASAHGYLKICEALIAHGAEVNALNDDGETPWDQALPRKQEQVRQLLEAHGGHKGKSIYDDFDSE